MCITSSDDMNRYAKTTNQAMRQINIMRTAPEMLNEKMRIGERWP